MCSLVSATALRNASLVIVLSVSALGGAVRDMETSPKGREGTVSGCSASTSAPRHASPSASAASASPPGAASTSHQCTANTCLVAWSNTTTSR